MGHQCAVFDEGKGTGLAIWGDRSLSLIDRLNTRQAIEFSIEFSIAY